MKITKFAQSNFLIETDGKRVLIDPGIFNREIFGKTKDFFNDIDVIIVTHKHEDHFDVDSVVSIFMSSHPAIFSTAENVRKLPVSSQIFKVGQEAILNGLKIKGCFANHHMRWGEFAGEDVDAIGILVEAEGKVLYHTADTVLPMEDLPKADLVFVPIGGRNVFTIDEAVEFVKRIKPKIAIPMHYDHPLDKEIKPKELAERLKGAGIEVKVLVFGESLEL